MKHFENLIKIQERSSKYKKTNFFDQKSNEIKGTADIVRAFFISKYPSK